MARRHRIRGFNAFPILLGFFFKLMISYQVPTPLDKVQEKFNIQKNKPEYKNLLDTTPVTGLWDDHDFNNNNGGKEYEGKNEVQKILLEFLDEPIDSPRRTREGLYGSHTFGPEVSERKFFDIFREKE